MLGGGGIAGPGGVVRGGGGMSDPECAVLGGGGIAEPERAALAPDSILLMLHRGPPFRHCRKG
jgi:hypothetical protein